MRKLIIAALTAVAPAFTGPQIVRADGVNTVSDLTSVASDICVENATGGCLLNEAASDTNPTVIPDKSDETLGIGAVSNTISFIVQGTRNFAVSDVALIPVSVSFCHVYPGTVAVAFVSHLS